MRYIYPVTVERDEDGRYVACAADVPEAITDGATREEALGEMSEALGAALAGYVLGGRAVPEPSQGAAAVCLVPVAPLVAAKLALRTAMREEGVSNVGLAQRLGISEGAVRRLVDPDHASRLDGVVAALQALGHSLIIEDQSNAA
ncbi:type II toxin-antitoxin system HicB family antitoxin [Fodinibius sp.]|uniref:type II toxin-antitoxin system HicB family antitoxin n=1 Tax=Fodinibius sp. TaxID=1872440 RepID=UPI002ACE300F|nr:type II toxin-antitoxin system HicB family antitoxin [Fodinibius sp.]MDZ7659440.1 type II toxin-antitoxin system HicB family antitoxin [Fodinibius sp.]